MAREPGETLYSFIERRERELDALRDALRSQLTAVENELAHIKSAKRQTKNLGGADKTVNALSANPLNALTPIANTIADSPYTLPVTGNPPYTNAFTLADLIIPSGRTTTIRDLILKAMWARFQENGATQGELRQYIKDAYGRELDRTSMSPQISRMKEEGLLKQKGGEDNWRLTNQGLGAAARVANANPFLSITSPTKK